MGENDHWVRQWCVRITTNRYFRNCIFATIILNAIVIGLETYKTIYDAHYYLLHSLDRVFLAIFIAEIGMKVIAKGSLRKFFENKWDSFDFIIIAIAMVPFGVDQAGIARIFRLLRVLRTVTFMPQLRLLVSTLLRTLPSLGNIVILLSLLFYFYATMGSVFFGEVMPDRFGDVGRAALTLFGIVTLEGWVAVMNEAQKIYPFAWIYFLSFIMLGTFIIINLFVAVVVSNLEQSFREQEAAKLADGLTNEELLQRLQLMFLQQTAQANQFRGLINALSSSNGIEENKSKGSENRNGSAPETPDVADLIIDDLN